MSAKEMFEELGYECFDDRKRKGLPLIILYRKEEIPEIVSWVEFNLVDENWKTSLKSFCTKNAKKLQEAINQQVKELGWLDE